MLLSWLLREFSSFFSSSRQSMYLIEVIFFFQSMYHNVNKWFLYYCLLQLIWGWLVAIICYNLQVQYMLFLGEKKSEQYFIIYFIFIGARDMSGWRIKNNERIKRPGHKIDKFPWMLEFVSNCNYGFLSYTQFRFQWIQWRSACTDKTMHFSVRAESVVELQLSRNVIHVKNPAKTLSCGTTSSQYRSRKKVGKENFFPIPKSINNTKSSVATFQLFSCVFKSTKTCFCVKTARVFFSGR